MAAPRPPLLPIPTAPEMDSIESLLMAESTRLPTGVAVVPAFSSFTVAETVFPV